MDSWLSRTEMLIGKEALEKLSNAHVIVLGIGGVGSFVVEALVRSGVGTITLLDNDSVDITNINRQLIADTTVLGRPKVEIAKERLLKINPLLTINIIQEYYEDTKADLLFATSFSYIVDCIDSVTSKLSLIEQATHRNIPIISAMGTGNKLDPTKFEVSDISKTAVCPLAKVIRKELKKRGIEHLKVVFSKEESKAICSSRTPASISFVPSVAGLILASEVIKDLIK